MGFRRKKTDQQNSGAHFVMLSSAGKKSAEILGKTIESAEVHYTFCDVEFRRPIGLNTKFRRFFFSRSQVHNLCSGVPPKNQKNKVRKKKCSRFGGTGSQFIREKKISRSHAVSCPIIGRNGKKVHKVRRDLFGKLI